MKRLAFSLLLLAGFAVTSAQDVKPRGDIRIVVVTHGSASDPFWSVVSNGVTQAAEDMGVQVEYRAPETFDMPRMAQLIDAAVASQPDGLVVSIPDADALGDSVRAAVDAGIPVMSMNSGSDVFEDLGVLRHVGQTEFEAGVGAGEQMAKADVKNAVCVNHEVGNVALDQRCDGFQEGLGDGASVNVLSVSSDPTEVRNAVSRRVYPKPRCAGRVSCRTFGRRTDHRGAPRRRAARQRAGRNFRPLTDHFCRLW